MPTSRTRLWCTLALQVCLAACAASSGDPPDVDAGDNPNTGRSVGSPCTTADQCDSPSTPECLTEIKPLGALAGVPAELAKLGLTFPDGYCSSVLNCAGDDDCGKDGACYRPFREVDAPTLKALCDSLMVSQGSLDFLPSVGVCLRPCDDATTCEVGQLCEAPMANFVSLVPGAINDQKFCVPDPACPPSGCEAGPCSPNPCQNGGTCAEVGAGYSCTCPDGYEGENCETQTTVPDRVIGQACESDAQCDVRGTPRCLKEIHPLQEVLPPTEFLATIGLDFAHGYCSNEPNCASNIECGPHGKCLAPFRNVSDQTLRDLEATFNPPLATGALDFLGGYGVCLRDCTDSFECFADQACKKVMDEFISQVPDSVNTQSFCVPHEDCKFCSTHAVCTVDGEDNGTCVCAPGYTGNGLVCSPTGNGACADNPCQNGGTCTDGADNTYTCACTEGHSGTNCQIAAACTPNPCENGGTCQPTGSDTFTCDCPEGFSGPTCHDVTLCPGLTAPSNGHVNVSGNQVGSTAAYECNSGFSLSGNASRTCQPNGQWTGSNPSCTATGNPCSSVPCKHGGVCTPGSGTSFTCTCTGTGYGGSTCETPVDCGSLGTIANGSIATVPASSTVFGTTATYSCNANYTLQGNATRSCQANATWSGSTPMCMANTSDPCTPNPCLNGGSCNGTGGSSFMCTCVNGYTGTTCQTPFDCGSLSAPANGTVTAASTTFGATATYACNANYTLSGSATRTCGATGWSGSAPTCQASSCGASTDVIYRLTGTFAIKGTTFGIGDQTFTGLQSNATTPPFQSNTNTSPFTGGGTINKGFARLRFTNDASGKPIAGTVRLVEWYFPLEFHQTNGAVLDANVDHSVGLLSSPLSNCGGGDATCTGHTPTLNRTCASNASGTLSGTTLNWGTCTPATNGANDWNYVKARTATGVGCATGYNQYGNNTTSSVLVPASGKGDAYQTYSQQFSKITFSGTNYLTATWTMADMQIPNGTGQSNTWLTITKAEPIGTDCGTTAGVDLVCNLQ